jgi:hypothetical protein
MLYPISVAGTPSALLQVRDILEQPILAEEEEEQPLEYELGEPVG